MDKESLLALAVAFLNSFQFRTVLGLIVVDVLMGVAQAIRTKTFDLPQLANFYRTNVVPYILGYATLYVGVYALLPKDFGLLPDGLVTLSWTSLVGSLVGSIAKNLALLYPATSALARRLGVQP